MRQSRHAHSSGARCSTGRRLAPSANPKRQGGRHELNHQESPTREVLPKSEVSNVASERNSLLESKDLGRAKSTFETLSSLKK